MEKNILFFAMPKTGSYSWAAYFYENNLKIKGHDLRDVNYKYPWECNIVKENWTFTFVRNPIDRFLSAFNYLSNGGNCEHDRIESNLIIPNNYKFNPEEWTQDILLNSKEIILNQIHFKPQYDWIFNKLGKTSINEIYLYDDGFEKPILEISKKINKKIEINKYNITKNKNTILSNSSIEIIENIYFKDFKLIKNIKKQCGIKKITEESQLRT